MHSHNLFEGCLVRLRAHEPDDAGTLFRHSRDSEIARADSQIPWPHPLAEMRRRCEPPTAPPVNDDKDLVIETLDGRLVGEINVQGSNRTHGTFSIGIGITDRAEWGKGYAKEAMLLVLRYMFHERRYQKCDLGVYAFNERAIGLYSRLGFRQEGRRRRVYFSGGEFHDELLLGITREEFDEQFPEWRLSVAKLLRSETV